MTDQGETGQSATGAGGQRGTLAYLIVAGVQRSAAFLALPLFTSALTPAAYGSIAVLISAAGLAIVLLPLGMETFVYRTAFGPASSVDREARLRSIVTFLVTGPVVLGAVLGGVALVSPPIMDMRPAHLASYLFAAGLTTSATVAPLALLRVDERLGAFAFLSLGYAGAQMALRLYLVVVLDRGVGGWVVADLVAAGCAAALGAVSARTFLTVRRVDLSHVKGGLAFGLPLVPHAASHWVLNLSDRLVIAAFLTPALVGIYSMSYQVASVASIAVIEVQRALVPRYGEVLRGDRSVEGLVAQQAAMVVAICGSIALAGPQAILRLLPAPYAAAADYVPLFALGFFFFGLYHVPMNTLILLKGQTKTLWRWTTLSGLVNLLLNILLVPVLGIVAGAIATVVGYALLLALVLKATMAVEGAFEPRALFRPVLPGLGIAALCSFGAVRPGVAGIASAVGGCAALGIATWFVGLGPSRRRLQVA